MKRILITSALALASIVTLAGCAGGNYDEAPAPQSKPSDVTPENATLYEASDFDENGIRHWLFTQKMPDGSTVTCIAADNAGNSSLAIDCPPLPAATPTPAQ